MKTNQGYEIVCPEFRCSQKERLSFNSRKGPITVDKNGFMHVNDSGIERPVFVVNENLYMFNERGVRECILQSRDDVMLSCGHTYKFRYILYKSKKQ